jgi:hypothetical protein
LLFQGESPKDLAVQFQKQDCIDFLTSAEVEADIFEYAEGMVQCRVGWYIRKAIHFHQHPIPYICQVENTPPMQLLMKGMWSYWACSFTRATVE